MTEMNQDAITFLVNLREDLSAIAENTDRIATVLEYAMKEVSDGIRTTKTKNLQSAEVLGKMASSFIDSLLSKRK